MGEGYNENFGIQGSLVKFSDIFLLQHSCSTINDLLRASGFTEGRDFVSWAVTGDCSCLKVNKDADKIKSILGIHGYL